MRLPRRSRVQSEEDASQENRTHSRAILGGALLAAMLLALALFILLKNRAPREDDHGLPDDFGILSPGAPFPDESPLSAAVSAWKSGYPWRALDIFEEALAGNLSQAERIAAYNYSGHIRIALADMAQARAAFNAALQLAPNPGAEYGLGRVAQLMQDIPLALECYARAVAMRGDFALAWRRQGDCYFGEGVYDTARERYNRALVFSDEELIRYRLAECALYLQEPREAERRFRMLLDGAQHKSIIAYSAARLADMESDNGNLSAAIGYYRQAIMVSPDVPAFRHNLGGLYLMSGQFDLAINEYNELRALTMNAEERAQLTESLSRNLGEAYYDRADTELALHFLAGSDAEDYEVLSMLGDLHFLRGDENRALEYYQRVLAKAPLSRLAFLAYANIGTICLGRADVSRALAAYLRASEIEPENAQLLYNLGFVFHQNGDTKQAEQSFLRAYTQDRSLTNALFALASIAGRDVTPVVKGGDDNRSFLEEYLLARIYHLGHEYSRAAASARRALALAARDDPAAAVQLLLMRALLALSDQEGAGKLLPELRETHSQDPLYLYCAAMYALQSRDTESGAHYLNLAKNYVTSPALRAWIVYWQGNLAWQSGKSGDALEKYREALDLAPGHTAAAYNASYCVQQMTESKKKNQGR
ncbi:MAG: tetratricopeptide repeat protein [Spirochaetota bacterium]|jgi:tetratricopeptide (TPR) repeat protein|nr:tetratricopeptide repeat protein [Spirochaetota bacterium]